MVASSMASLCNSLYVGLNMVIAVALLLLGVIYLDECKDMEIIVIYPIILGSLIILYALVQATMPRAKGEIAKYAMALLFKVTSVAPLIGGVVYFGWTVTYTSQSQQGCDTFMYMTTLGLICMYYILLGIRIAGAYANSMLANSRKENFCEPNKKKITKSKLEMEFEGEGGKKNTRIGKF